MTIEFCAINKPEDWMVMVAEQFGTSVINDKFAIPPSIGSGFFKQYYPLSWLTLTYIRFVTYEPITMIRRSVENSKWIPIMFYINEHKHEQIIGTSTKTVGIRNGLKRLILQMKLISDGFSNLTRLFICLRLLHLQCSKSWIILSLSLK